MLDLQYLKWITSLWEKFFSKKENKSNLSKNKIIKFNDLELKQILSKGELINVLTKISVDFETLEDDLPNIYFVYKQEKLVGIISRKSTLVLELLPSLSSYDYKIIKLFQLNMKCSNNEIIEPLANSTIIN